MQRIRAVKTRTGCALVLAGAAACIAAPLRAATPVPAASPTATACPAVLRHTMTRLQDSAPQPLCQYAGKVLLVVNTASQCGYTPQYKGLEALHTRYAARGLVVMGFPSNDFGQQEPGDARKIGETCFNVYGVRFPMFDKISVVGAGTHPLYAQLAQAAGGPPRWNFHKYLVDRQGRVVAGFPSAVEPEDARLTAQIEALLAR
ncbi:MAG TPA: glutathione peroxidase [Burkholderiaceae bacterium]|nr:glutathione peroxidase [Burkholderiaceae bacterium]